MKILMVCLGNICRSPMAEAVMRHKIEEANLGMDIEVSSAGTSRWENGNPPYYGTRDILDQKGISYAGIISTQITQKEIHDSDLILTMDKQNYRDVIQLSDEENRHKVKLFLSVLGDKYAKSSVPDPYYTGDFDETYRLVEQGCTAWLKKLG